MDENLQCDKERPDENLLLQKTAPQFRDPEVRYLLWLS